MRGHTAFRPRQFHMLKLKWGTEGKKELRMRPMQACLSLSPSYLERKGDSSHQCLKKSPNNLQFMVWLSRLFRSCSPIPDIESSASDRHPGTATNIYRMHRVIVLQCHLFWFSHQFYEVTILLSSFLYRWGDWGLEKLQELLRCWPTGQYFRSRPCPSVPGHTSDYLPARYLHVDGPQALQTQPGQRAVTWVPRRLSRIV